MKTKCQPFPQTSVEIAAINGITDGLVALAIYSGASTTQTYFTADELDSLIRNLTEARDELIGSTFPAIEVTA
jgi:type IV secretory pathway ATPase VirB11/archaellum biosynthesis ATPase